ncbi:hypothetical protein N7470_010413 [Penicillium chermesinum]|nr:hypothetical protein N7470_010413 [Penicillium chermesinum]
MFSSIPLASYGDLMSCSIANRIVEIPSGDLENACDVFMSSRGQNDFERFFDIGIACFVKQLNDGFWTHVHPGYDTEAGRKAAIARLVARFNSATTNHAGQNNTVFKEPSRHGHNLVRARSPASPPWVRPPPSRAMATSRFRDLAEAMGLNALYPEQEAEQNGMRGSQNRSFRKR